ncbi:hypothetical protein IMZ08_15740 [Bacillus luteolus]|uniref:Uncharacterized protein n=1 Tax=Litchfieldia luteola TaxID=682179 RepID=A0ABR9QLW5_9BACI|nr:CBO0543 family protein [Cytobacillus luteolus]MBE4909503.1 hypothetical protein [Cytobacillus luteolus]MBP1940904.1 hypothetical protein [Cytobacillus luteolus]
MSYEKIENYQKTLLELELQYWLENSLFTPAWLVLLAAALIPWIIWYKYVDRSRFQEIILFGMLWMILATVIDEISSTWMLWSYPRKLFPTIPPLIPADLTIVPVVYMFIYQYTATFKVYMFWSIIVGAVFSFVIEVIFVHFDLFKMYRWEHWYSFISFIIVAAIIKGIHQRIMKVRKLPKSPIG